MVLAVNDEPPVDPKNWFHRALVGLHELTRIPSPLLAGILLGVACVAGALWYAATRAFGTDADTRSLLEAGIAAGLCALFLAVDWAWLAALPRWKVSFGPVKPPLVALLPVRLVASLLPLAARAVGLPPTWSALAGALPHLLLSGVIVYATYYEPFRLGVTYIELETPKLARGQRVRLVQLSDLHVERVTRRERALVDAVNALDADHVLLTGDYLNFSYIGEARAIADVRQVLGRLSAREGIYAVRGTHQVDPNALLPVLFDELPVRWLRNEHLTVGHDGHRVTFAGASCTRRRDIDVPAVERALAGAPEDAYTVLLYHTPDLVPEAASGGADLYLAGHTHGGQIRLPWYGALITATDVGKRYEMGRYDVDGLTLYVSRGVGMEGMAAPRARFLCPPEIVCIDVTGI